MIAESNARKKVENIATYDFSTLYTNIHHDKFKERTASVIKGTYEDDVHKYMSVYSSDASFVNNSKSTTDAYTQAQFIEMVDQLSH